ncbi:MAG: helix-turn-helix domain-containing protein [Candidatus Thorarchaeota archaeon]
MRKVTIDLSTNPQFRKAQRGIFDKIESIEGLELFRFDFKRGDALMLTEFKMKKGYSLEDAEIPREAEILTVLETTNDIYTCLMRLQPYRELETIVKKFDIDVVWDTPLRATEERRVYSAIADQENMKKLLSVIKLIGTIESTSFHKATYGAHGVLSCLTARQKEILILAKKMGYYEYPRKIGSENLSQILGISRATTIEHLRKAENRIMAQILAGY